MPETLGQLQHQGEWYTLDWLRRHGGRVDHGGWTKLRIVDIQEGKPIIIGNVVWTVFLHDRGRHRFFLEQAYVAETETDLHNAFKLLEEEWV